MLYKLSSSARGRPRRYRQSKLASKTARKNHLPIPHLEQPHAPLRVRLAVFIGPLHGICPHHARQLFLPIVAVAAALRGFEVLLARHVRLERACRERALPGEPMRLLRNSCLQMVTWTLICRMIHSRLMNVQVVATRRDACSNDVMSCRRRHARSYKNTLLFSSNVSLQRRHRSGAPFATSPAGASSHSAFCASSLCGCE